MVMQYTPPMRTIEFNGGKVELHGLSALQFVECCQPIAAEMAKLFDGAVGSNPAALLQDERLIRDLMGLLWRNAPAVMASLIAKAADAEDQIELVSKLPIDVTVACFEAILNLSCTDGRAFLAIVSRQLGNAASAQSQLTAGRRH